MLKPFIEHQPKSNSLQNFGTPVLSMLFRSPLPPAKSFYRDLTRYKIAPHLRENNRTLPENLVDLRQASDLDLCRFPAQ